MYHPKNDKEAELQIKIDEAHLSDTDFKNLYWQLWGACACTSEKWSTFEYITRCYLRDHHK
jgi:hypothetical protein